MANPLILVMYNKPLLPENHPDAESEHSVVDIAEKMATVLESEHYRARLMGLGRDPSVLWKELKRSKPDVVFNLFEGHPDNIETESHVAALLEWTGIPFTGSSSTALSMARAKHVAKTVLRGGGLPTCDYFVVGDELAVSECRLPWPVIVKPAQQDASVGLDQASVCTNRRQLAERVAYIMNAYGAPVLVEQYVRGREFNVALIELPELQTLPAAEIVFKPKKGMWPILTYAGKWHYDSEEYESTPAKYPADLPPGLARRLSDLAMRAYRLIGCRDYARVDFRVTPRGKPYVLEINPNPELGDDSGFARYLDTGQVPYRDFIVRLIETALARGADRARR